MRSLKGIRGFAAAVVIAAALTLLLATPAYGDTGGGSASGWGTDTGGGVAVVGPVAQGGAGRGGGGTSCSYAPWISDISDVQPVPPAGVGYFAIRDCDGAVDVVWTPNAPRPLVPASVLAQQALGEVVAPGCVMRTSPRPDVVVVQIETWLWLECPWQPVSATAGVPGLSATVTATPGDVVWDMGDGEQATCQGPGVVWDPALPVEDQSTYCSHAYRRSSSGQPDGTYTLTATVSWSVSWSATNGEGGTLPAVSQSSSIPIRVGEVQALSTQ